MLKTVTLSIITAAAVLLGANAHAAEATGAGSSFFFPLATKWADG